MEWLANLTLKWVLIGVGSLLLVRTALASGPVRLRLRDSGIWRELLESALIATVVVFLLIRPYFFQAYYIPSESMHPTLRVQDRILVNKLAYRFGRPRRGDILVFRPPEDRVPDLKDYIKRVVGLPGETVEVVPERVLVDGRTVIRVTREAASDVMRENYQPEASVGFTYPIHSGSVIVSPDEATLSGGLEGDLRVMVYRPGDVIQEEPAAVFLNNRAVLAVALGTVSKSYDLTQWGGDPGLVGAVYEVNGTPRLVLVQGERLTLDDGHVRIDGRRLAEPFVAETPTYAMPPLRIPPRHYFLMGDNRNRSFDSHAWGPLGEERIVGRAELIFWPPNRAGWIHGR